MRSPCGTSRPAPGPARAGPLLASLCLLVPLAGRCAPPPAADPAPAPVIILSIDTLRRDHLSCYGYPRATSPHIDQLAKDSTRFTNAVVPRPLTSPSVASLLTGMYPYRHGVPHNFVQLHESLETLAERLAREGYQTAAFVSNYMLLADLSNFHQGFEHYDDILPDKELHRAFYERIAADTVGAAMTWLEQERDDRPLLLWVHLMDPHGPYTPPAEYKDHFPRGESEILPRSKIPGYQFLGSRDRAEYVSLYDAEIFYSDLWIGRLLDALRERGLYDPALIVFHADHGEALGEHGEYFRHGQDLYEPCLGIPLIIKPPAGTPSLGSRSDVLASVIDIYPTIFDLLGKPIPPDLDGESLKQVIARGGREQPALLMERLGPKAWQQDASQIGIRTTDKKLIYHLKSDDDFTIHARELYDLAAQPTEETNLYPVESPLRDTLDGELGRWWERVRTYQRPFETIHWEPEDPEKFIQQLQAHGLRRDTNADAEALRELGYLDDD